VEISCTSIRVYDGVWSSSDQVTSIFAQILQMVRTYSSRFTFCLVDNMTETIVKARKSMVGDRNDGRSKVEVTGVTHPPFST